MLLEFHHSIALTKRHRKLISSVRSGEFLNLCTTTQANFNPVLQQTGEGKPTEFSKPNSKKPSYMYIFNSCKNPGVTKKLCYCFCFSCRELLWWSLILRRKQNFLISCWKILSVSQHPFQGPHLAPHVLSARTSAPCRRHRAAKSEGLGLALFCVQFTVSR